MPSYHFPIIVGDQQNERIVMVHLFDRANPENYKESRVIFTQCIDPFFKVPKKILLVSNMGEANPCTLDPICCRRCRTVRNMGEANPCTLDPMAREDELQENMAREDELQENVVYVQGTQNRKSLCLNREDHENDGDFTHFRVRLLERRGEVVVERNIKEKRIVRLTFTYRINGGEYKGKLHIVYCPYDDISYTNIDLGSDVTQVRRYKGEGYHVCMPLVDLFKQNIGYSGENRYLAQYYENNETFYRTGNILYKNEGKLTEDYINYLSLNLEGLNHYMDRDSKKKELGQLGEEDKNKAPTQITVKSMTSDTYKTYPNIKVLYKMSDADRFRDVFPFRKEDGTRVAIDNNSFFKVMAEIYKKLIQITAVANDRFHSVLLLVPNIYSQLQVDELVYHMSCAMNGDLAKATDTTKYYDFRAISESDAAFLGNRGQLRVNWDKRLASDFFLMIDSGRGTTDYSVIGRSGENTFTAIRRGGIVGAGGAIDYVFAYIYAKHLFNEWKGLRKNQKEQDALIEERKKFQEQFMMWLSKLPSGPKEKIRLEIENLKIRFEFEEGKKKGVTYWKKGFFNGDAIENIIKKSYGNFEGNRKPFSEKCSEEKLNLDDEDVKLISYLCSIIAEKTIGMLARQDDKDAKYLTAVDYVVYTGRAFDFPPLKNAFEKRMKKLRKNLIGSVIANRSRRYLRAIRPEESKANTVCFDSHNLNINLNSDICCLHDLMRNADLNDKTKRFFTKEMLFEGYTDGSGNTTFYLGYFGADRVWSRRGVNQEPTCTDQVLAIMTLYPNAAFDNQDYESTMELLGLLEGKEPSFFEKLNFQDVCESIIEFCRGWVRGNTDKTSNSTTDNSATETK